MTDAAGQPGTKSDPWIVAFTIVLVLLWILVLIALFTPEAPNSSGSGHSRFQTMDQGGDGGQRHRPVFAVGWLLGSVMIAFFTGLLAWGTVRRPSRSTTGQNSGAGGRIVWFLIGGLLFEAAFGMTCSSYWTTIENPTTSFSGPFPVDVSWMIFGVWLAPAFFVVLYMTCFHRWILPPENVQRFEELKSRTSDGRGARHQTSPSGSG